MFRSFKNTLNSLIPNKKESLRRNICSIKESYYKILIIKTIAFQNYLFPI